MSIPLQYQMIVDAWVAGWVASDGSALTPYALDDQPVNTTDGAAPTAQPWARLTIRFGPERQMTMGQIGAGQVLWRNIQAIVIQLFTPTQTPQTEILQMCEIAGSIYRGKQFVSDTTDVVCFAASTAYVGRDSSGFNQSNVTIQAYANELR